MRLVLPFCLALFLTITACAQFPALDGTVAPADLDGPYPDLIPLTSLIAQANAVPANTETAQTTPSSRLSNLQNRAATLRSPVIAPLTRATMVRGVR